MTILAEVEKGETRTEFAKVLMGLAGFRPDELANVDLAEMTDEQVQEAVKKKLGFTANQRQEEIVINQEELSDHLRRGYSTVAPLSNGNVVVRIP